MSVRLLPRTEIELIASFIWHGNMSYTGGGTGQLIPYDALVQMLQKENQRNFVARYPHMRHRVSAPWQHSQPIGSEAIKGALNAVNKALSSYDYSCFNHGEIDANGSAVHALTGRAHSKLDELLLGANANPKRKRSRNQIVQDMAAPIIASRREDERAKEEAMRIGCGDVFACYQSGVEFKQGPSGNWLWRIPPNARIVGAPAASVYIRAGDAWHRPRGATTREAAAKACREFCGL